MTPVADPFADLPAGWSTEDPDESCAAELTALTRAHEQQARGWAGTSEAELRVSLSARPLPGRRTRENVVVRDAEGAARGWGSAHDRAAGRVVLVVVVDPDLQHPVSDAVAGALFGWADVTAGRIGSVRGLLEQQIDSGAFDQDERQHGWLTRAGFTRVRSWWQMSRPVAPDEADLDPRVRPGVRLRPVARSADGMPDEDDLRTVHQVLETAFGDHFNSHEETFEEFVSRLHEDPGHRWDHWWVAELTDRREPEPAGALVASEIGAGSGPQGSYVDYLGVLQNARGRGVATSLLRTVIADAADRGRDRVGLEVDADSPTGAEGLYVSMGWRTSYVTQSWHRAVRVPSPG